MQIPLRIRRILVTAIIIGLSVTVLAFAAIATPMWYRVGLWRTLPVLDHRLLPHLSAIFAAAFGAFFASLSAFYLGRYQQESDRRERRHAALIRGQYALMSQWNIVEAIRVQHLEDLRNDPIRFTKLKLYWFPIEPTYVPLSDLTFLLETRDPNIVQEIQLAEQNYRGCIKALQLRNEELQKFYDNPRVSHHIRDFETGAGVSHASDRDLLFLRQATDVLYIAVDRRCQDLQAPSRNLRN
jgi:hypothetical protein